MGVNNKRLEFKKPKIEMLPEDWKLQQLGEVLKFGSGRDYKYLKTGDIPVYETGGLMTFVNEFLFEGDSVGIGRKGTIDKPVFLSGKFWTVDTLFFTHSFHNTTPKYIYYQFERIQWKEYNEASGVPSLNKKTLEKITIPLPPLPEQKAIAEVLSDTDAWIESLEQLIAKKHLIKHGAMQELLKPSEDWEVNNIKEITTNIIDYRGVTPKKLGMEWGDGGIVALSAGNVKKGFIDFSSDCYYGSDKLYKRWMRNGDPKKNDIVFTLEAPLGNVALLPNNDKYILSQRTILLQLSENFDFAFIFQTMLSSRFQNYIRESATGSTAQGIKRQVFEKLLVAVPKSVHEQIRIAGILSDMDTELDALAKQLNKARQLKQGMMQELLSGRIRLL